MIEPRNIEPKRNLLVWGLLLSVGIHSLFLVLRLTAPSQTPELVDNQTPIELTQAPPETSQPAAPNTKTVKPPKLKPKEMEMAETEDANNRKIDPNAKILSDRNQTADKQTRAKQVDDFRAKQGTGMKSNLSKEKGYIPPTGTPSETEAATNDIDVNSGVGVAAADHKKTQGIKRDWKTLSLKDLSVNGDGGAAAASDDRLNGVEEGDRTVLSTREYKYFSYYNRIKELLRQYWKPSVEEKMYHLWAKGKTFEEEEMVTRLLVLLNTDGKITKISRVGSSGVADLDEAAIEAFQKAGPFPNPPKGIVDADGFVRINWEFILKTAAAPAIQFSGAH